MNFEAAIVVVVVGVAYCVAMSAATEDVLATEPLISHAGPNAEQDMSQSFLGRVRRSPLSNRVVRRSRFYSSQNEINTSLRGLVSVHNRFRRQEGASNMEGLYWDDYLASTAQAHADRCDFFHSSPGQRAGAGENIWAAPWGDFSDATRLWFVEGRNCGCGCSGTGCGYFNHCCGHYTQVTWATTNAIGCGYRSCGGVRGAPGQRHVLVCHYRPAGNVRGRPAFQRNGAPCSQCPSHAPNCRQGLCYR